MLLIFIHHIVGPTNLVNLFVDKKINKLRKHLDPLEIPFSSYDFNYTFYFQFKLGSISWSSTVVSGLANLQRVGDVSFQKRGSFLETNISVACVDLKVSSVMSPRLGNFQSTVDVPVTVSLPYVRVNFCLVQRISFREPPTVNHLAIVQYQDLSVHFELNDIASSLLETLTAEVFKYYRVKFKEMMETSIQQKMNKSLVNYTLPGLFNPIYWFRDN